MVLCALWLDHTVAFPYNPLEAAAVNELAQQINLNVTIVSKTALDLLNAQVSAPLKYWIKVDVGTHRTGVLSAQAEEIRLMAQSANPTHELARLLCHAGHSYGPIDPARAREIYAEAVRCLQSVKDTIGRQDLLLSYGDTPTYSLLSDFSGMHELRPGNLAFYDIMQHHFGSCDLTQIAVCMACPVVKIVKFFYLKTAGYQNAAVDSPIIIPSSRSSHASKSLIN